MKRILLFLFCFVGSFVANAQYPATGLKQQFKNGIALGSRDSTAFGANDSLVVSIDRNGKMIFRGNGVNAPFKVVSVTSDTAAMLLPYLRKSDTASMLAPYVRSSSLGIYLLKSDSLSGGYTTWLLTKKKVDSLGAVKLNISDTAAMLLPYARTSSLGSYLLKSDSLSGGYTTWLLTKKKVDSLGAVKLNISDTAAMLSPYVRTSGLGSYLLKSDSLSGGYTTWLLTKKKIDSLGAVKLNVLDTAAMLANRLKISDTAYMLSGYARTGNIPSTANFVPYDGATRNVNLGTNRVYANDFSLRVPSTSADTIGRFRWNADDLTANLGLTSSVVLQTGQELLVLVKNQTGVTIPNGTVVRQSGVVGSSGRLLVEPFLANGQYNSNRVLGITTEDIADGADGFVTSYGKVNGVNTAAYPDSTILYASPTVAGGLTATPPTAPNNIVKIGTVVKSANPNGIILTRIVYGSNINQDEGVQLTNPLNSSLLVYDSVTTLWKNKTLVEIGALRVQDSTFTNGYTTRLRTKQIIDSLGAVKLNISDTAAMLAGYKTYYPRTAISLTTTGSSGAATYNNATGVLNIPQYAPDLSGYVPYTGAVDNVNLGNFRLTARSLRMDSVYANGSGGVGFYTNSGTKSFSYGAGGSTEVTFHGFAGYDANRSASYTTRSFTDKGYVDSADALRLLISDTAAMLLPYLRKSDTATMLSNYRRKTTLIENADLRNSAITINGTSTALGGSISVGTVTSVAASAGTGISVSGSPITSNGTLTITNTAPDQTVTLTAGTGISVSGTYPNFTVTNTSPSSGGTVTSVTASAPLSSSGGTTPNITISQATTSTNGFLSSTDWNTFNNKQAQLNGTGFVRFSGTTPSYITGTSSQFVKADGSVDGNTYLTTGTAASTYLPLTGGTLTGALNGTSAAFSVPSVGRVLTLDANTTNRARLGFDVYENYAQIQAFGQGSSTGFLSLNPLGNNVGIGTASPDAAFATTILNNGDYKGLLVTGSENQLIQIRSTTAARQSVLSLKSGSKEYSVGLNTDNSFSIYDNTAAATRFSINNSGVSEFFGALNGTSLSMSGGATANFVNSNTHLAAKGSFGGYTGAGVFMSYEGYGGRIESYDYGTTSYKDIAIAPNGGNVLIGTTTTDGTNKLIVNGGVTASSLTITGTARFRSSGNWMEFSENVLTSQNSDGAHIRSVLSEATVPTYSFQGDQNTGMYRIAADELGFATGGTQRLSINSTGAATFSSSVTANDNVTINKSTGTLLDIRATSAGGTAEIKLNPTSNNSYSLYTAGGTDALEFKRNGTTLVTYSNVGAATFSSSVTVGGQFNLGTNGGGSNYVYFPYQANTSSRSFRFAVEQVVYGDFAIQRSTTQTGSTYENLIFFNTAGNASFLGTATATGFFESSDLRLKNIVKRDGDVVYFNWKNGQDKNLHIGYIAQEVQKTNPDQVKADEKGMLSVNYTEVLVQKVRDLERKLEKLERELKTNSKKDKTKN